MAKETTLTKIVRFHPETLAAIRELGLSIATMNKTTDWFQKELAELFLEIREGLRTELATGEGFELEEGTAFRFPDVSIEP